MALLVEHVAFSTWGCQVAVTYVRLLFNLELKIHVKLHVNYMRKYMSN